MIKEKSKSLKFHRSTSKFSSKQISTLSNDEKLERVLEYHEITKHYPRKYAKGPGMIYLLTCSLKN